MSAENRSHRARAARTAAVGVPAAIAGSIALVLSASPAHAAVRTDQPLLRALPAAGDRAGGPVFTVRVPTAVEVPAVYTVQRGDTISAIATRYGLRVTDVLALNGLGWRSTIYPGQVIRLVGTAAAAPAAPVAATPVAASVVYTVKAGDTISAIAKRNGVSTQSVLAANGLGWSSIIYPGQKLTVAGAAAAPAPAAPAPAAPAAPSAPGGGTYTIKSGDTISSIASRNGVSVNAVLSANKLGWSSIIYPGQTITIPLSAAPAAATTVPGLSAEQTANARTIVQVGRQLGVPDRGIAIALGAAMTESGIRNLDWGDRDSLGLFQQRPSTGWGSEAEIRDPVRAAKAFYGGPSDPNGSRTRGLLDIPGWQDLTFTQAAQAVQISAYPDAYAKWEQSAYGWLAALG